VIKCNRCGNMTPAGATCQSCGAPLSNKVDDGFSPHAGRQDQPEVPAWLESLRAGERPAAPADNPSNFTPADLIEEGNLPSWMRAERNGRENTGANPALQRPSAYPDPSAVGNAIGPQNFAAQSLIDEKSLPSWMQEEKPATPPSSPGSLSASSLVQPDSLPEWMRTLQQTPAAPAPAQPAAAPPSSMPAAASAAPGLSFSAHDLIDEKSLPSWMQSPAGKNVAQAPQTPQGFQPQTDVRNVAPTVSSPLPSPAIPPSSQGGQAGLAASSLLDMDALPQWLREGGVQRSGNMGAPQARGISPNGPGAQAASAPQENGRVSASSFIDMNALPNWLRANDGSELGSPAPAGPGHSPYNGAANASLHADNMRVPSRPRGEVNQTETSEMAANVFASMLGVASSTPSFSGPPTPSASSPQHPAAQGNPTNTPYQQPQQPVQSGPYGQSNSPAAYGQLNQAGGQMSLSGQGQGYAANPYSQMSQAGLQQPGSQTNVPNPLGNAFASQTNIANPQAAPNASSSYGGGYAQNYQQNAPAGYGGYGSVNQGQGHASSFNNGMSNSNAQSSPYGSSAGNMSSSAVPHTPMPADEQKGKKRGIFEAIRDWLSR
jgi:hypothetical protein